MATAETIHLQVVTPARAVLDIQVDQVVLPGVAGEFGVLPGHLPLLTALTDGEMRVHDGGRVRRFVVDGGFAEVNRTRVTVMTQACEGASEIDMARAKEQHDKAETELKALEERRRTEVVDDELLELHRRELKRARLRLLHGDERPN